MTGVRRATRDDVPILGPVLGRAFAEDPIWSWVYPQEDAARRLARMFAALLRSGVDSGATVLTEESRRGVALWQRSERRSFGLRGNLRIGASMLLGGARLRRTGAVMQAVERRHPREPHWYLAVLGADPSHQRTGIGTMLLRHVLDDPANAGEAAYLETETEENVPYYARHGFEVIGETDIGRGGPHLWFMWREPRPA